MAETQLSKPGEIPIDRPVPVPVGPVRPGPGRPIDPGPVIGHPGGSGGTPKPQPSLGTGKAADGSTVVWTASSNGAVLGTGTNGRTVLVQPVPNGTEMVFSQPGQPSYLAVTHAVDTATRTVTTSARVGNASVAMSVAVNLAGTGGQARVTGNLGAGPISWVGPVAFATPPDKALAHVAGWKQHAFAPQLQQAAYFGPALQHVPGITRVTIASTAGPLRTAASVGGSLAKAGLWGVATVIGVVVVTVATGGTVDILLGLAAIDAGLASADASIWSDVVDQWTSGEASGSGSTGTGTGTGTGSPGDTGGDGGDTGEGGEGGDGAEEGGDGGGGGCFVGGTLVELADGDRKPIEAIREGDLVTSRHEETGLTAPRRVTKVWRHPDLSTISVRLDDGEVVIATEAHRIFTMSNGLRPLAELEVGERILTLDAAPREIVAVNRSGEKATVYNLTVDDLHTYFVGVSRLWVHNTKDVNGDGGDPPFSDPGDEN